jgi:hypothetical protein
MPACAGQPTFQITVVEAQVAARVQRPLNGSEFESVAYVETVRRPAICAAWCIDNDRIVSVRDRAERGLAYSKMASQIFKQSGQLEALVFVGARIEDHQSVRTQTPDLGDVVRVKSTSLV